MSVNMFGGWSLETATRWGGKPRKKRSAGDPAALGRKKVELVLGVAEGREEIEALTRIGG